MKELVFSLKRKDFDVTHIRGHGPGGQHRNKVSTGVRIVHRESGAVGEATDSRSQDDNRKAALQRLVKTGTFRVWMNAKLFELRNAKTVEQWVEEQMCEDNLKVEVKLADADGKLVWTEVKHDTRAIR